MVVEIRSRKDIELEICEAEKEVKFLRTYNRLKDASVVSVRLTGLMMELDEIESHESAEAICYE